MGDYASKEKLRAIFADMASKINLNTSGAGVAGGYTPIGTIIAYMGKTAPEDHLPCDGSLHQIAKYPQLADFFHEQFGRSDIFGGNGITSFAMPDLRGEFLRGAGGNGGEVMEHQDATLPNITGYFDAMASEISGDGAFLASEIGTNGTNGLSSYRSKRASFDASRSSSVYQANAEAKPTNTSVLWCIKAYDTNPTTFKEDETMIGRWLNVPLYQKVIRLSSPVTLVADDWTDVINPLSTKIPVISQLVSAKLIGDSVMYFETKADTTNDVLKVFNPMDTTRSVQMIALEYIKS